MSQPECEWPERVQRCCTILILLDPLRENGLVKGKMARQPPHNQTAGLLTFKGE